MTRDPRPATVCREPGDPIRRAALFLSRGRGVTLGHRIFLPDWCADDPAVLAHEMEHVRQYEEWGALRYYARGMKEQTQHLLSRVGLAPDPYDWRRAGVKPFEEYGMEQQGQLVEDAVRGDRVAGRIVEGRGSTVDGQRSTVDGQRSRVNGRRSTVNGRP